MGDGFILFAVPVGTAVEIKHDLRLVAAFVAGPAAIARSRWKYRIDLDISPLEIFIQFFLVIQRRSFVDGWHSPIGMSAELFLVYLLSIGLGFIPGEFLILVQTRIVGHPGQAGEGIVYGVVVGFDET